MNKVEAVIRPFKLEDVKAALSALGVCGMTVTNVCGTGQHPEYTRRYGDAEYTIDLLPRVKVEVVVRNDLVPSVISAVCAAARTGGVGDGMVFVLPITGATRIRTGEAGDAAL
jgi:nitrogen regulatory protein P-II 1